MKVKTFGVNITLFIKAYINFSKVIPLYLIKPIAAKGTAPIMHIQDKISIPNNGLNTKYRITAIIHAKTEKNKLS